MRPEICHQVIGRGSPSCPCSRALWENSTASLMRDLVRCLMALFIERWYARAPGMVLHPVCLDIIAVFSYIDDAGGSVVPR